MWLRLAGRLYYPRNDQLEDAFGNRTLMEPHTGNVLLGYARLNVPDGLWRLYNVPLDRTFFEKPALTRVVDDIEVQPLYITVDPERDTLDVLRAFLKERYPRFIGVTGSREQIDNAKRAFRVFAQRRDEGAGDYVIPHTAITYVLDPAGRFIDHWPPIHLTRTPW